MALFILRALSTATTALGAYGLFLGYNSATNLQKYESQTERAAKYSGTAEYRLHKTRTTQSTAIGAMLFSVVCSASSIFSTSAPSTTKLGLHIANAALMLGARQYVWNFWHDKARVPFVEGYNDGIRFTENIIQVLGWLGMAWGAVSAFGVLFWVTS